MGRVLQSPGVWRLLLGGLWAAGVGWAAVEYARDPAPSPRHPAVRMTAFFAVCYWAAAASAMLHLTPLEWALGGLRRRVAGWTWGLGFLMLLVHLGAAFHLAHGWSHRAAYEHAERASGFGAGVFVNYLVVAIWGADAAWLAAAPDGYARRPAWVGRAVHGFLAFVTFNATVVYGTGLSRWSGAVLFAVLAVDLVRRYRRA